MNGVTEVTATLWDVDSTVIQKTLDMVKNPPANAGDTGSIPGPGRSHMPWSH